MRRRLTVPPMNHAALARLTMFPTMARLIRGKKENPPVWRRQGLGDSLQLNASFLQVQKYKVVTGC